jgi:hypothetical protein
MDLSISICGENNFEHYVIGMGPLNADKQIMHLFDYLHRRPWIAGGRHEAHNVRTFLPGVGSLANYHPIKFNGKRIALLRSVRLPLPLESSHALHCYSC